ncbi:ABC transporter permease [Streptomyces sp. NPDC051104]|uniref:ABC transporter permease n=1 Tax=Streptomyces sp. NPDC051104 TaxID=3155044 RepID=UPI00342742F7
MSQTSLPLKPATNRAENRKRPALPLRAVRRFGGWESGLLALLVLELVYFSVTSPDFLVGGTGLLSLSMQFVAIGIVALGLAPVVLSGGIDLSVGATAGLTGVMMGTLWQQGLNIWLAALAGMVVALLIGLVNGLLVVRGHLEPLIGTLAVGFIVTSVATVLAGNNPPYGFPASFTVLGTGLLGPVPLQLILFAVLAVLMMLVMNRTEFGRSISMIGHNPDAARYSGIGVGSALMRAYAASALFAGVAGLTLGSFYSAVRPNLGDSLLLPGITIVVLGGVDIFGGRGKVLGVILAVFTLGYLTQGLLVSGYSNLVSAMIESLVMLAAIAVKLTVSGTEGGLAERLRQRLQGLSGPPT